MHPYGEVPFVRIAVPFILGILLYAIWQVHLPLLILPGVVFGTLSLQWLWQSSSSNLFRNIHWLGLGINISLFLIGNQLAFYRADINHPDHFMHAEEKYDYAILTLLEPPVEKDNSFKATICVSYLLDKKNIKTVSGKAIIYLQKDSLSSSLHYGDEILAKNNFTDTAPPKNPDEFNYKRYLWYQGIYSTAYLKGDDWKAMHRNQANWLLNISFWLRDHCREAFQKYIVAPREESVMEALVVGYRDRMALDIQQAYASAGVIHVLAVSGLHVGILYLVLERLLFFMRRKKQWRRLQSILIVLVIWLFAFVTGLSGSVVRSAMMFSLIAMGKNWNLRANPFNVMASSALIILVWNPLLIMDVGFQLSYAAVISISAFVPYMNWWMTRETKLGDSLWKTTSMSVSAQLGTLPFTTFYFHQFPTLFLIANVIVIPVSGVLLIGGIALALLQWCVPIATVLAFAIEKVEWLMNEFIVRLSDISFSVIRIGNVEWWQAVMMLLIIVLIVQYFLRKEKVYFFLSFATLCLLTISAALQSFMNQQKREVTVYAFPKNSLLEFRDGNQSTLFADSSFTADPWHSKYLQQYDQWRGICSVDEIYWPNEEAASGILSPSLFKKEKYFQFQNFRMVCVSAPLTKQKSNAKLKVDVVLISQNAKITLKQLLEFYDCHLILFDGSDKSYRINKWKEEAASLHVTCYDVMKEGAWVISL